MFVLDYLQGCSCPVLTVEHYQQRRQQSLAAEAAQNSDTAELLGLSPKASTTLAQLVDRLRSIESSVTFQALLHQEAALHAQKTSYSRENFAYNSTPFASWAKVGVDNYTSVQKAYKVVTDIMCTVLLISH